MVGDNPHTDILGGMNFGFHTCWFNPNQKETPIGIQPTFQVRNHDELSIHLCLNRYISMIEFISIQFNIVSKLLHTASRKLTLREI